MRRRLSLAVLPLLAAALLAGSSARAAVQAPPLVEPAWVAEHAADPGVRIVDLRNTTDYLLGHVPGAVSLPGEALRNGKETATYLPERAALQSRLEKLGISDDTRVVAYDEGPNRESARLWLLLRTYGDRNVSLLDGGMRHWLAEKRPVTRDAPKVAGGKLTLSAAGPEVCPVGGTAARNGQVVLDARGEGEYRLGHVPGAVHVDYREDLRPDDTFRPADELRKLFAAKGVTPDREVTTYCQSGGRAAHSAFTLVMLGYPKVRVYYGSMQDYRAKHGPEERGDASANPVRRPAPGPKGSPRPATK